MWQQIFKNKIFVTRVFGVTSWDLYDEIPDICAHGAEGGHVDGGEDVVFITAILKWFTSVSRSCVGMLPGITGRSGEHPLRVGTRVAVVGVERVIPPKRQYP